jgi:hypothetical protein
MSMPNISNNVNPVVVTGTPMSQNDISLQDQYRNFVAPSASLTRLDDFGKWLFTSVTVVSLLGAGLSSTAAQKLEYLGKYTFGLAIILLGMSLACAALASAPRVHPYNPANRDSMIDALNERINYRARRLQVAGFLFALSLISASLAPLLSSVTPPSSKETPRAWLTYSLAADGKLTVELFGQGLAPYSPLDLALVSDPATKAMLPRTRGVTSSIGSGSVKLELPSNTKITGRIVASASWVQDPERPGLPVIPVQKVFQISEEVAGMGRPKN